MIKSKYGFITDSKCTKDGKTKKSYKVWTSMIYRCYNKNSKDYKHYGAKGVTICDEWKFFSNFEKWYDKNYKDGYQIDKDINGGNIYSPDNCILTTRYENIKESNMRKRGSGNHKSKEKKYYETKSTPRADFKKTCIRQGWRFDDFKEIFSGEKYRSAKKYYYIYIGDSGYDKK